jgi:hypothetical protein
MATEAESEPSTVTDAETCEALVDVVTIQFNADLAVHEDRMTSQEQQRWYILATHVLDRVPTRGKGPVSEAVAGLKAAAPPVPFGAMETSRIGSEEWGAAYIPVMESCRNAGSEIATWSFTGG